MGEDRRSEIGRNYKLTKPEIRAESIKYLKEDFVVSSGIKLLNS
jgi:hypothetical protein